MSDQSRSDNRLIKPSDVALFLGLLGAGVLVAAATKGFLPSGIPLTFFAVMGGAATGTRIRNRRGEE